MAEFTKQVSPEGDLTIISVEGDLSTDEILAYSKHLHEQPDITNNLLWDTSKASLAGTTAEDYREMETKMKDIIDKRVGGKTAIVGDTDLKYGFGRLYSAYAELEKSPVRYGIFHTVEEAMDWLKE